MKLFGVLILVMTCSAAVSANQKQPISGNSAINMKMHYTEIVPGEKIEFTIGHKKYCPQDNLSIKQYESEEYLSSTENDKKVPVKILNIHVRLFSPCSNNPKKVTESLKVPGDKTRMTHVYLFSDTDMNINQ